MIFATFYRPGLPRGAGVLRGFLAKERPLVMGVLNVTPDSFSDGGRFLDPAAAIAHARRLAAEGADILDIGAESTRPYGGCGRGVARRRTRAACPDPAGRGRRSAFRSRSTRMKAAVAAWALEAGAAIVNDVWGLQRDPDMARVVAEHDAPVIVMHNRDAADPTIDIIADVTDFFSRSLDIAWPAPAFPATASCSIPASASARRRSRA